MRSTAGTLLVVAVAATAGACRSTGATPYPFPMRRTFPATASAAAPVVPPAERHGVIDTALALRGTPYRNGGADPDGFDCSGFTQYVFWQHGLALPRAVKEQFEAGLPIAAEDLEPGDLLFFSTVASGPSHVGISVGEDWFVHAPSSTGVVRLERASADYWSSRFVGARRIVG